MNHSYKKTLVLRALLLLLSTMAVILLAIYRLTGWAVAAAVLLLWELWTFYRVFSKTLHAFQQFVESVHYHDFSQHFNTQGTIGFIEFRKGFNTINQEFLAISKEKETQYQYLQKMLELLDNGILLYAVETGEVKWMNEALKKLLGIPFFKNIRTLHWKYETLYEQIIRLPIGKNTLFSLKNGNKTINIQLTGSQFRTGEGKMQLVVFQNINEVVDITESQAWNQLLRILTHEIMNSVAPISSLASTIENTMKDSHPGYDADLLLGIQTIKNRSEGLLRFAEAYRNLNKIEKPKLQKFSVRDLFESLDILFEPRLSHSGIELEIILPETNLQINADQGLLEQAFINLLLNAIDAVKEAPDPCIQLYAARENHKVILKVVDNGKGMPEPVQERIFIPFFSTKKSGSGIGLSLCKQILLLHGGNISVYSIEGKGSQFILTLG